MPSWNVFQIPKKLFQSFSIQRLVVDIQHFRRLCQLEDEYAQDSAEAFDKETPALAANAVIESPKQKRKRNKKDKYGPNDHSHSAFTANLVVKSASKLSTPNPPTIAGFPNKRSNGERERSSSTPNTKKYKGRPNNNSSREVSTDRKNERRYQDNRGREEISG